MIPDKHSVLACAASQRVSFQMAARRLLGDASQDELISFVAGKLANAAKSEARRQVTSDLPDLDPNQLTLFELHYDLPSLVRVEADNGEELYVHWQNATLEEHAESLKYRRNHHLQQAGICERLEQRIFESDVDRDIALGYLIFPADTRCIICGDPWMENDPRGPFEQAHVDPVAGRSGNSESDWAHQKCNQSEGTR